MSSEKPIISCRDLTKVYVLGDQQVHPLPAGGRGGQRGGLYRTAGPAGSDKPPRITFTAPANRPTSGAIWLNAKAISKPPRGALCGRRKIPLGFLSKPLPFPSV